MVADARCGGDWRFQSRIPATRSLDAGQADHLTAPAQGRPTDTSVALMCEHAMLHKAIVSL